MIEPASKMVLTVTLNTGVDRVLLVDALDPGHPVVGRKEVTCVGGKGLNASVALCGLRVPTVGLSFMAGENGRLLERIVAGYGIVPDTIWVEGETRNNYVIAEARHEQVSHIKFGALVVRPKHIETLVEHFKYRLKDASWVLLAGSIPDCVRPSLYGELVNLAHQAGVPALLDSRDRPLLEAISSHPAILKMNRDEFNSTFGLSVHSVEHMQAAAAAILSANRLESMVLTCGADGIVAITSQGAYQVHVPPQTVANAAGAGDAASAALTWRLGAGDDWQQALKWAGAVSAAAVLTDGTGEVKMEDVERIYPQVGCLTL